MKKVLILLFTLSLIFTSVMFVASCEGDNSSKKNSKELEYTLLDDNTYKVSGIGSFTGTDLVVPDTHNDKPVTVIDNSAFWGCRSLTSVIIGNNVTSINRSAFQGCSNLTSVIISNSVTDIGGGAFYDCSTLTSVIIGNSVSTIGDSAFRDCKSLTSITVPNCVTSIGGSAFSGCSSLTSVVIPDSVTSISEKAFSSCSKLTSVIIGNGATSISYLAFYDCNTLTSVTIGNGVTDMGNNAFYNCDSLENIYYTGDINSWVQISGLYNLMYYGKSSKNLYINGTLLTEANITTATSINSYAFCKTSLIKVTIGNKVISIGGDAFSYCSRLASVVVGNGVTSIGKCAFWHCNSLTSVTIGSGVTSIGSQAFQSCYKLVEVINKSSLSITAKSSDYGLVGYYASYVHNGESLIKTVDNYQFITPHSILNYLLGYLGNDTEITLPSNYNGENYQIDDYAFYYNTNLTKVTIPSTVTAIPKYAFSNCSSLASITIPSSVTHIGNYAFYGCNSLISIIIPDSVTHIGNATFANTSLTSVIISDNVSSIGSNAFSNCDSLEFNTYDNACYLGNDNNPYLWLIKPINTSITSCTIHSNTKSIADYAFQNCSSLTSVTIGKSVTSIGDVAFSSYTSLENIYYTGDINSWVQISGLFDLMLYGKSSKNLYINGTLLTEANITTATSIDSFAFYNYDKLTKVTIGNQVTSIGYGAFSGCSSLTSVTFKNTSGWYRTTNYSSTSGTSVSVTNPSQNATYLTSTYTGSYWKRK